MRQALQDHLNPYHNYTTIFRDPQRFLECVNILAADFQRRLFRFVKRQGTNYLIFVQ